MKTFDFTNAIEQLKDKKDICICGHVNPDGDCLGSMLALKIALQAKGHNVFALLADAKLPRVYDFLPGYDNLLFAKKYPKKCDAFICVDVSTLNRIGNAANLFSSAELTIVFDHHQGDANFADIAYVDSNAPACAMIIWDFISQLDASQLDVSQLSVEHHRKIATCCMCGLITDTGRFQYQNADDDAFKYASSMSAAGAQAADICANVYQRNTLASLKLQALLLDRIHLICNKRAAISWISSKDLKKLGATKDDTDMLINVLRSLDGVEVALVLREEATHVVHGSIRSKTDKDVSKIAEALGGGGHKAAAGFTCEFALDKVTEKVEALIEEAFANDDDSKTSGNETSADKVNSIEAHS